MRKKMIPKLSVALSQDQFEALNKAFARTSDTNRSEYIRKLLFRKPITIYYRNRAYDEFIEVAIGLNKILENTLQNGGLTNEDATWLRGQVTEIKDILIKIDAYARENKFDAQHP